MTPAENIIYGTLKHIQSDNDNIYTSIEIVDNLIKANNYYNIHDIYVTMVNDILSTKQHQDPITTAYRIKSYITQFIKIVDNSNKVNNNPELVNLKYISDLYVDISNMLKCRFILINKKSDKKFVDSLLDCACTDLLDLKNILFNTLNSEYASYLS